MSEIKLTIGEDRYKDWQSLIVKRSILQLANEFSFTTDLKHFDSLKEYNEPMGKVCYVDLGEDTLVTGYIDDIPIRYDANSSSITFKGRDITQDLVDCGRRAENSAFDKDTLAIFNLADEGNQFSGMSNLRIIIELVSPFGNFKDGSRIPITVSSSIDPDVPGASRIQDGLDKIEPNYTYPTGSTVYNAIKAMAEKIGMLVYTDGNGNLILGNRSSEFTDDELRSGKGGNIKAASFNQSNRRRYSDYYIIGRPYEDALGFLQDVGDSGGDNALKEGHKTDDVVDRYRPFFKYAQGSMEQDYLFSLAERVARINAGFSRAVTYTVQGWTQTSGKIWPINRLVKVRDDILGINKDMLIVSVENRLAIGGGTTSTLTLVPKTTFDYDKANNVGEDASSVVDAILNLGG